MSTEQEPNFDRVAVVYRWAEYLALGSSLQRIRTYLLADLANNRHALLLGDGDGRFLAELLHRNGNISATALDSSERMLSLLRKRCAFAASRVRLVQGSALTFTPAPDTDLVVSHFFLDCLTQSQMDALAKTLSQNCQAGTVWLISDFQVPEGRFLRVLGKLYIRLLYAAFGLLTNLRVRELPDIAAALTAANFRRVKRHQALGGLLYTELWELVKGRQDHASRNLNASGITS